MSGPSCELCYVDYLATTHRPGFDGLRAIGFLLVVTAHIPSVPLFSYLQGWSAVWVFFVISGYLVTMLMLREEKSDGGAAFRPFLIKRFFRIVPSYYMAILIYWFACFAVPPFAADYEAFTATLPYYVAFLPEYANKDGFNIFTHAWTVGIELKFYLFFPPVIFLLIKDATWRFAVIGITTAFLTAIGTFTAQSYCAILFGAMLALMLELPRGYAAVAKLTRVPVVVPLGFVVALFAMLQYREQLTVVALVMMYVVAYVILQRGAFLHILNWRPLVYLGQRSYGAYLLHFLVIRIGYLVFGNDTAVGGLLTALFCLAVTIPAAELLYQAIERPGMEYGRRRLRRRSRPR